MTRIAPFKKALLTGGTGFVGRYLSAAFRKGFPDADLVLLCRPGEEVPDDLNVLSADLTDYAFGRGRAGGKAMLQTPSDVAASRQV